MKLHLPGRRDRAESANPETSRELTDDLLRGSDDLGKGSGKGRPTPKRSHAQGRRPGPPPPPPTTRKEAYKRMREQQAANRATNRRAMLAGDESALPARDRGPVRKLVRDIVDARRNIGSLFLAIAGIALIGTVVPNMAIRNYATFLMFTYFLLLVVDSVALGWRIKKIVTERFPDAPRTKGLVWYGISRSTMVRRWRFPKPAVAVGAQV